MAVEATRLDRAYAALTGMAIGDAMGMPSQTLTVDQIRHHYGRITGFVRPYQDHPVSHGLEAGQVTDDTEQAMILAHRLIAGRGRIDEARFAKDLLAWETDVKARGLRDLLGPSTKAALDAMLAGEPLEQTGRSGTTNGAAMRVAPIGIATSVEPLEAFVDQVEMTCRMTHNTGEAIAGAAAVAAVIACGVDGQSFDAALQTALRAAEVGQRRGYHVGEGDMVARIEAALSIADRGAGVESLAAEIGTSVASGESVATAFGVVKLAEGDLWQAVLIAANIGDDTDTIGAIAGAMAGACSGMRAVPEDALRALLAVNELPLEAMACDLLQIREETFMRAGLQGVCS